MQTFWEGLGILFTLIGIGIAGDFLFNGGDGIEKIIKAIKNNGK